MSDFDIDTNMDSGGDAASEMLDVGAMRDQRIEREGEQDKRLDDTVRMRGRRRVRAWTRRSGSPPSG